MVDTVVYRYVSALKKERNWLDEIILSLEKLSIAFENSKLKDILLSYEVSSDKKVELLNSIVDSEKVHNLVKFLAQKHRLLLIPQIYTQLKKELDIEKNNYSGIIYSKESLSEDIINQLQEKFSNRFNINLSLKNSVGDYDGLKIEIEDLGVEIGFSNTLVQSQLKNYILKAV